MLAPASWVRAGKEIEVGHLTPGLRTDGFPKISAPGADGTLKIKNDEVLYTPTVAPTLDGFTYTVEDSNGGTVSGTVITGDNNARTVSGSSTGYTSVMMGDGADTVALFRSHNAVHLGKGSDSVSGGTGDNTVIASNGTDTVSLKGSHNDVVLGNGKDTISLSGSQNSVSLGNGHDKVSGGTDDVIRLTGTNGVLTLKATNETVFLGPGNEAVKSSGSGLTIDLADVSLSAIGKDTITNTGAAAAADIVGLPSGITPTSDGHGGTLYTLGAGSSIDFVNFSSVTIGAGPSP